VSVSSQALVAFTTLARYFFADGDSVPPAADVVGADVVVALDALLASPLVAPKATAAEIAAIASVSARTLLCSSGDGS
jgi:hypothetical protein